MTCYVCATTGRSSDAVALCQHCNAGLCLEHVKETAANQPGGLRLGCDHSTWSTAR